MKAIGFSQGVLFRSLDVYSKNNIQLFIDCGCNALEVNYHQAGDAHRLDEIIPYIKNFDYVSIHMPCDFRYGNNEETRILLGKVESFYIVINAQLAVVHPDLVDDWSVFDDYKINWAIENMDDRKKNFKDVHDLKEFFNAHNNWVLVLDLGHCNVNDKTMVLADDLISNFKDKIKEIHLSGYETLHDPLFRTKQLEIIDYCRHLDVPIIIESTFEKNDGTGCIKEEYDYIIKNLE